MANLISKIHGSNWACDALGVGALGLSQTSLRRIVLTEQLIMYKCSLAGCNKCGSNLYRYVYDMNICVTFSNFDGLYQILKVNRPTRNRDE